MEEDFFFLEIIYLIPKCKIRINCRQRPTNTKKPLSKSNRTLVLYTNYRIQSSKSIDSTLFLNTIG